jgi:hypothetical protein
MRAKSRLWRCFGGALMVSFHRTLPAVTFSHPIAASAPLSGQHAEPRRIFLSYRPYPSGRYPNVAALADRVFLNQGAA